jgi:hypothetical protein
LAPVAASATLRPISAVVALCSSTAEAMVVWNELIRAMTSLIWVIESPTAVESVWIISMRREMSSVALAVS